MTKTMSEMVFDVSRRSSENQKEAKSAVLTYILSAHKVGMSADKRQIPIIEETTGGTRGGSANPMTGLG